MTGLANVWGEIKAGLANVGKLWQELTNAKGKIMAVLVNVGGKLWQDFPM